MKPTTFIITSHKYAIALIFSVAVLLPGTSLVSAQPNIMCTGICDLASSPVAENLFGTVDAFGLWLVDIHESEAQFFPHENALSLSFDPTGQYVAVVSCPALAVPNDRCKGSISLFDIQAQTWRELGHYDYAIDNVKFSPDGKYVAFQKDDITRSSQWGIQLIDLTTNDTLLEISA